MSALGRQPTLRSAN